MKLNKTLLIFYFNFFLKAISLKKSYLITAVVELFFTLNACIAASKTNQYQNKLKYKINNMSNNEKNLRMYRNRSLYLFIKYKARNANY